MNLNIDSTSIGTNCHHSTSISLSPFLNLQQSLWKDINGVLIRTVVAREQAVARSSLYLLEYERKNILLKAKFAYWDLAYLRTVVDLKKLSLERLKKI
ncbi:MAG: hypothetical protein LBS15_03455 [Endomicrobium sp.]|nr:hypothetical protein [Endomicrobium sp.]